MSTQTTTTYYSVSIYAMTPSSHGDGTFNRVSQHDVQLYTDLGQAKADWKSRWNNAARQLQYVGGSAVEVELAVAEVTPDDDGDVTDYEISKADWGAYDDEAAPSGDGSWVAIYRAGE